MYMVLLRNMENYPLMSLLPLLIWSTESLSSDRVLSHEFLWFILFTAWIFIFLSISADNCTVLTTQADCCAKTDTDQTTKLCQFVKCNATDAGGNVNSWARLFKMNDVVS